MFTNPVKYYMYNTKVTIIY